MPDLATRFWAKVEKTEACWIWNGSLTERGYGCFRVDRKTAKAHRVAYELAVAPIPPGLTIDHLCFNTRCVRPDHLEPVTMEENTRRAKQAGRFYMGNDLWRNKTRCPRGHAYDAENTRVVATTGERVCRICTAEHGRRAGRRKMGLPEEIAVPKIVRGHAKGLVSPGVWCCSCGLHVGPTRRVAAIAMKQHRADLEAARMAIYHNRETYDGDPASEDNT